FSLVDVMNCRRSTVMVLVLAGIAQGTGLAGCKRGPAIGEIHGRVTFQEKPVSAGTISFFNPELGSGADAPLGEDGTYVVKTKDRGLVVGEYIVFITPETYIEKSDPTTPAARVEKNAPNIPEKYRRQGTTPLKATVAAGKNELNFDMQP